MEKNTQQSYWTASVYLPNGGVMCNRRILTRNYMRAAKLAREWMRMLLEEGIILEAQPVNLESWTTTKQYWV